MARQAEIDVSLQSDLPGLKEVARNATRRALTAARQKTVEAIKTEAPTYVGSFGRHGRKPVPGELKESIKELDRKTGEVEVGTNLYYANWVEFGTAPHEETGTIAWPGGDHPVRKVTQHASGNGFFKRGILAATKVIPDVVESVFKDAIDKWETGR